MKAIETEARFLAKQLLDRELDEKTVARYEGACERMPPFKGPQANVATIIKRELDVEAIEYALRSTESELTKRIHILLYLVEGQQNCFNVFVNSKRSRLRAFWQLGMSVLRAPLKLLKGKYLIWRYGLV